MAKESFMLVSLNEDKAKKLAQVIGNPTCTRILDYLAGKDATESQVAKDLKIPLSTVHYNLQQLVQAKLVVVEEFHYSEKGREVNHYKLANKYIIIAPKDDPSFAERIRKFLPVALVTAGVAAVLKLMQLFTGTATALGGDDAQPFAAIQAVEDTAAAESARTMMDEAPSMAMKAAEPVMQEVVVQPWWQSPMVDWFIVGALFVLAVLILGELINHWRERRR